jgi:hypothetical protein
MVYEGVASTHKVKPLPVTEDTATVVEVVRRARDSYGEGYEGEGSGYLIFQVGNRYFKKTFYESSYSDEITFWDNDVEEVFGQVKTVMTFIPKED